LGAKLLKILQREAKFKEFLRKKAFKGKKVKKPPMRDAPGAIFQDLRGPAMESLGTGARRG
jgi:hypothetical protein